MAQALSAAGPADRVDAEGVWCELRPDAARGGAALFLDRDGVVVEEADFLSRVEDIALVPGAAETIAAANRLRVPVVLITNQSGIARGYFGWREFAAVQEGIVAALGAAGARIDAVYACPHHPSGRPPYRHPDHPARKPNPGMLRRAAEALSLDLARSWLIGDRVVDIGAARAGGLAGAVHVLTGYGAGEREAAARLGAPGFELLLCASIAEAASLLPLLRGW